MHHGAKLENRMSKESYLLMNHLLGSINTAENYPDLSQLTRHSQLHIHVIAIDSDLLFPASATKECYNELLSRDVSVSHHVKQSPHGHDAFLIEYDQLSRLLAPIFNVLHASITITTMRLSRARLI